MPHKTRRTPERSLPEAVLSHQTTGRVRLKIAPEAGRADFFQRAREIVETVEGVERVAANPLTGSLLLLGAGLDLARVVERAEQEGLFTLARTPPARSGRRQGVGRRVLGPLRQFKITIQGRTPESETLSMLIVLALLGAGAYQIWRGHAQLPPWHAAVWYALGLLALPALDGEVAGGMMGEDE